MFCVYTEIIAQDDTVTFSAMSMFLPMSKVDQS